MNRLKLAFLLFVVALLVPGLAFGQGTVKDYLWTGFLDIPDGTGEFVGAVIPVPDDGDIIADVDVDIIIQHTWQGDMVIELEAVGGPRVPLMYRAGDSASGGFGFSADNFGNPATGVPMILDDEAGAFYDSSAPNGIGAIPDPGIADVTDAWIPYGQQPGLTATLSAFDGLRKGQDWILWVNDNQGADTGAILQFSLHITNVPEPSCLSLLGLGGLMFFRRRR